MMKRLYLIILIFLLPLIVAIYLLPVERRQRYIQLKEDCSFHGIWLFDRVHSNKTPVDVMFLGSSHTINGIWDDSIERQIYPSTLHVVNFGYCRYGMNLQYVLLKEILKEKKPRLVFLEVREDENRYSHPVFPYLADALDVFLATPFFNRDIVRDYFDSFLYRLKILKVQYFCRDSVVPFRTGESGFMGSADTASKALLEKAGVELRKMKRLQDPLGRWFYMTWPRIYLKKIAALCVENGIHLKFIYLPQYGSQLKEPMEMSEYRKYGEVLIPPHEIFADPGNWGDENHLNHAGAAKLSAWLAGQIRKSER
jgi:hypothetical protein